MNRREFSQQLCGAALSAAFAKMAVAQQQSCDTSGKQHSMPEKPAEIAMLIYPDMTRRRTQAITLTDVRILTRIQS